MDICNTTSGDNYSGYSELERLRVTNGALQEENTQLRAEVEDLNTQLQQYKLVSQSFEMRVLDLQKELKKHEEEAVEPKNKSISKRHQGGEASHHLPKDLTDENGCEPEQFRKLFIGGLSYTTTDQSLRDYFSQFGQIVDCVVMKDAATKRSRGFGFVVYAKIAMVDVAQDARPHVVDKREVETKRAVPKGDQLNDNQLVTKKIFVGGLRDTTDEAALVEYFSNFGKVDHIDLIEDRSTKRMRGFAYVSFSDCDPVDKAVLQKFHVIDGRRCEVKKALSRVMMKNRISAQGGAGYNQAHHGWNSNFYGGGNFDGMCGGGGAMNMGGCGGGNSGGFNDFSNFNGIGQGGRNICSGWNQCMGGNNWGGGGGGHYCGDSNHGFADAFSAGSFGSAANRGAGRNHDHSHNNTGGRGGRGRRNIVNAALYGNGEGSSSPKDFTSD